MICSPEKKNENQRSMNEWIARVHYNSFIAKSTTETFIHKSGCCLFHSPQEYLYVHMDSIVVSGDWGACSASSFRIFSCVLFQEIKSKNKEILCICILNVLQVIYS